LVKVIAAGAEQLSVAVGVPKTTVVEKHSLISVVPKASGGQVIAGGVLSNTLVTAGDISQPAMVTTVFPTIVSQFEVVI
jgi:hypothetical protein